MGEAVWATWYDLPSIVPATPLEKMIDEATGYDEEVARAFVEWFDANVWGDSSTPDG